MEGGAERRFDHRYHNIATKENEALLWDQTTLSSLSEVAVPRLAASTTCFAREGCLGRVYGTALFM